MAKQARKQNMFAYSKYELARHTSEFQRAKDILNQDDTLAKLSQIVSHEIADTHDMFISCFRKDDFLNIHQDGSLGTFAFVLSLTRNWTADDGGLLRLFCRGQYQKVFLVCRSVVHARRMCWN
jgi:Rps23 Pro-64 3,4-dihydroxylase Tpa1-like proline 4-hydroxylase